MERSRKEVHTGASPNLLEQELPRLSHFIECVSIYNETNLKQLSDAECVILTAALSFPRITPHSLRSSWDFSVLITYLSALYYTPRLVSSQPIFFPHPKYFSFQTPLISFSFSSLFTNISWTSTMRWFHIRQHVMHLKVNKAFLFPQGVPQAFTLPAKIFMR